MSAKFVTGSEVAHSPAFDPDAQPPLRFNPGRPFEKLDVRPGRVLLVGAPPASGKTALALQVVVGVLQNHPDLKALFACCEMTPADLLARVVARLAGVPVNAVMDRAFGTGEREKVKKTLELHAATLDRLAFLHPPFTLEHLADAATDFGATVLGVDYLQRFGHGKELRESLDGVMSGVRKLALAGAAVVAISSVARQKDDKGRSAYSGLGMASFRGSAELEFGADSAFVLDAADGAATLRCVKDRFGKPEDMHLRFNGAFQQFTAGDRLDVFDAADGGPRQKRGRR